MRVKAAPALSGPDLAAPAVNRMLEYARRTGRDTSEIVSLVRGEPDFDTPPHIRAALIQAVQEGYTHYPPTQGYLELREAVAERVYLDHGARFDPESEILITTGGTAGMYVALCAIVRSGDEVLIPDPMYDPFANQVRVAGGVPVFVPAERRGAHFQLSTDALAHALTPRTRAVLLNTPWNPTGSVFTRQELMEIGTFALEHELYVIVDELYEKLVYDGSAHYSMASLSDEFRENVVVVNSFSKTYAMTGWRLGYNLATPQLTKLMRLHYEQFSRGSPAFVQRAGIQALLGPQDSVDEMLTEYTARRELMLQRVNDIERANCLAPEGTFFCLVDVRAFEQTAEELARALVRDWGLLTVPGTYYGNSLEGFLRLSFSYAREDIRRGLELLERALEDLSEGEMHEGKHSTDAF